MQIVESELGYAPKVYTFEDIDELLDWINTEPEAFRDAMGRNENWERNE